MDSMRVLGFIGGTIIYVSERNRKVVATLINHSGKLRLNG